MHIPDLKGVRKASENLRDVSIVTPLNLNERLSEKLNVEFFLKEKIFKKFVHLRLGELLTKLNH